MKIKAKLYDTSEIKLPMGKETITKQSNEYWIQILPSLKILKWKMSDYEIKYTTSIELKWLKWRLWIDIWK